LIVTHALARHALPFFGERVLLNRLVSCIHPDCLTITDKAFIGKVDDRDFKGNPLISGDDLGSDLLRFKNTSNIFHPVLVLE
jgi:hypothetical protein